MAKKRKWQHILDASKQEALLAVELYNRGGEGRRLEAFIIHMHLAWLHLLHARTLLSRPNGKSVTLYTCPQCMPRRSIYTRGGKIYVVLERLFPILTCYDNRL